MIYKEWLNEWLNDYIKITCKIRTFERYSQVVNKHILQPLGSYEIDELTPSILQKHVSNLLKNGNIRTKLGLSANTVNCIISVIQSSLKTANKLEYSKKYIGDKIIRPKITESRVSCFTNLEQEKIEQYIITSNNVKLYGIILCLYSGLRIGELLALEIKDIDFDKSIISVSKTCYDSPKGRIIGRPKSTFSNRIIPIPKQILQYIKKLKKQSGCSYLIAQHGKYLTVRSYQRSFELLLKKLKIKHKGFHTLRHTFATRAIEYGMDVKTLSEILGHKNPMITLNRYVHSMIDHKRLMMNRLGRNLYKKTTDIK